jgi:hypothetical protein
VGEPVPAGGRGGDGGPVLPAAGQPGPDAAADRAADRGPAGIPAAGPGPDRVPPGPGALDRARGPGPLPLPAAGAPGPGRRRPGPPLRAGAGELVHVDVKKLGSIPDGGWLTAGRAQGKRNRQQAPGTASNRYGQPLLGYGYLHTALDDHSRLAYTEVLPGERKERS